MIARPEVMGTMKQCWPLDCVASSAVQTFDYKDILKTNPEFKKMRKKVGDHRDDSRIVSIELAGEIWK
jgi:hypothetical protein